MSSAKSTVPKPARIPEGFAEGTMGAENSKYVMAHYMVPAYEHSLLVEDIRNPASAEGTSADEASPYVERDGQFMNIPNDQVGIIPFLYLTYLIFSSALDKQGVSNHSPLGPGHPTPGQRLISASL